MKGFEWNRRVNQFNIKLTECDSSLDRESSSEIARLVCEFDSIALSKTAPDVDHERHKKSNRRANGPGLVVVDLSVLFLTFLESDSFCEAPSSVPRFAPLCFIFHSRHKYD